MSKTDKGGELDALWTVGLDRIEKLMPDEPDDESHFAVEFELQGPAANATVTAMVFDPVDEADIIRIARTAVRDALERWLKVLECHQSAGPFEPTKG